MLDLMRMFFVFTCCVSCWEIFNGENKTRLIVAIFSMCVTWITMSIWSDLV